MKRKCLELLDKSICDLTSVDSGIDLDLCNTFPCHHHERKRRRREIRKETCNIFSDSFDLDQFYSSESSKNSTQTTTPCCVPESPRLVSPISVFSSTPSAKTSSIQQSLDCLRANLIELGLTPSNRFENSMRQRFKRVSERQSIRMKISQNLKAEEKSEIQRKEDMLSKVSEVISTPHKNSVEVHSRKKSLVSKECKSKPATSIFHWFKSSRKTRQHLSRRSIKKYRLSKVNVDADDAVRPTLFCMFWR